MSRPMLPPVAAVAAALFVALASACSPAPPTRTRSALVVTLDTTRADALTCLGGRPGVTPRLDALASQGVLYTQARTTAPITLPAHASILTGLYPIRHSARDNGRSPLPSEARTLAELATDGGLDTAAFVASAVLDAGYGLDQGFGTYVDPVRPPDASLSGFYVERPAEEVVADALAWLRSRDPQRPFLMWVHLFDPHAPYVPPPEFARQAGGDPYLGEVARADAAVGRLLDGLHELGRERETLVVVVADHGEALGEHGEASHGSLAYDSTLRVPLILRYPDHRRAGERNASQVSVVDVLPTVAAELGLRTPAGLDGVDLGARAESTRQGLYFETAYGFLHYGWSPISGWLEGGVKYLHDSRPELFDVSTDPRELRDQVDARRADVERARRALAAVAARPRLEAEGQGDSSLLRSLGALGYATAMASGETIPEPLAPSTLPAARTRLEEVARMAAAGRTANEGHPDEAAAMLADLLDSNPGNRTAREHRATYLIAAGHCDQAIPLFEALAAEGSRTVEVYLNLGYCLQLAGRDQDAADSLLFAHDLDPGNPSVLRNLVPVLARLGREEEAKRYRDLLEQALTPTGTPR